MSQPESLDDLFKEAIAPDFAPGQRSRFDGQAKRPGSDEPTSLTGTLTALANPVRPWQKGGIGRAVVSPVAEALAPKSDQAIREEAVDAIFDPSHEAELTRIKTQAMMSEFMSTDPVISTYDPEQVMDAYNQIVALTPRAAQQPAVMRGLLRKMLQQQDALEPFEAAELTGIEKTIKDIQTPDQPQLAPLQSAGEAAGVYKTQGTVKHTGV